MATRTERSATGSAIASAIARGAIATSGPIDGTEAPAVGIATGTATGIGIANESAGGATATARAAAAVEVRNTNAPSDPSASAAKAKVRLNEKPSTGRDYLVFLFDFFLFRRVVDRRGSTSATDGTI